MSQPTERWATLRATRTLWREFRSAAGLAPPGAWRRWMLVIGGGWVACAALTWAVTALARRADWLAAWDERTLRAVERGPVSFQNAILLESLGNLIYMIPLVACAAVVAIRVRRPMFAVTLVTAYALARPLVILGWKLWNRPRPTLIAEGIAAPPLHSFPSGHIVLALSVYGLLCYAWVRASRSAIERTIAVALTLAWCGAAGYARVRLGSHWPSDVIAGGVIGIAWALVVALAACVEDRTPRPHP